MQGFVKRILNWRKGASAIHQGKTTHYVPENGVYVTFRYDDRQKVMIILNKNENKTTLKLERFKGRLGDIKEGYDMVNEKNIELRNEIQLNRTRTNDYRVKKISGMLKRKKQYIHT